MKNVFLAIGLLLASSTAIFAQQDPAAQQVLEKMKVKYEQMTAFEATVVQEVLSMKDEVMGKFEGKATVKKNKYKIDLGDQVIYNNEQTIWRHLVEDDEVSIHSNNASGEGQEMFQSPSKLYKIYKDGFKYALVGEEKVNNALCSIVELVPQDRKKFDFFKVKLYVSKADATLVRWMVFERDEAGVITKYRYTVKDFKPNVQVSDAFFSFDKSKYPKIDVIDMRD